MGKARKKRVKPYPVPMIVGRRYMKGGFQSMMLGCHPKQVDEFNAQMKRHGCQGVIYDKHGNAHVSSEHDYSKVVDDNLKTFTPAPELTVPEE